jgi:putative transposase
VFAGDIRRQRISRMRGFRHWRWHLDEMCVKLNGEMVYLWRGHCQTKCTADFLFG